MKYLKTFESMGETYEMISDMEFLSYLYGNDVNDVNDLAGAHKFCFENSVEFSDIEFKQIKNMFDSAQYNEPSIYNVEKSIIIEINEESSSMVNGGWFSKAGKGSIEIFKRVDDWYYVEFESCAYELSSKYKTRYYKCDQWDGLLDCLRHLKKNYERR